MHLIGEIGGTKAQWVLVEHTDREIFSTDGFNPRFTPEEDIQSIVQQVLSQFSDFEIASCTLYIPGASNMLDSKPLVSLFPQGCQVHIHSDLLAAARATLQQNSGVVAILGTGSNAQQYDGNQLLGESASLGYVLGDHGGGTALGKRILLDFVTGNTPKEITQALQALPTTREQILKQVYTSSSPQRYLASFARFSKTYEHHPYISQCIADNFKECITRYILPFGSRSCSFSGGMAYHFQAILRKVAKEHALEIVKIIDKPLEEGLLQFHRSNVP